MKLKNRDLSDLTNLTEDQQEQLKNNKFLRNLYINR
jgi:hypothetical protein